MSLLCISYWIPMLHFLNSSKCKIHFKASAFYYIACEILHRSMWIWYGKSMHLPSHFNVAAFWTPHLKHSTDRHEQLASHILASFSLGKECTVPIAHEAGLAPKPVWTLERSKILDLLGIIQFLGCPAYSLITVTAMLSLFLKRQGHQAKGWFWLLFKSWHPVCCLIGKHSEGTFSSFRLSMFITHSYMD